MADWAADARLSRSFARTGSGLHGNANDPSVRHANGATRSHADADPVRGTPHRRGDAGTDGGTDPGNHAGADHAFSRGD